MKLRLRVTPIDGNPYEVETNLFTVVALERKYKIKASDLAQGVALEYLTFLAYESCKQGGEIVVPIVFDDYVKSLSAIEIVSEDDANPTEVGATTAL